MRLICVFICDMLGLAVETDGDDERAGLRHVEEIVPLQQCGGAGEVRLRIESAVAGPRVQVASSKPEVDAAEPKPPNGRLVRRIRDGDLAELRVASVLRERFDDVR